MISSSESTKILNDIEKNYPVEELKCLDFDLWPNLKFRLHKLNTSNEAKGELKKKSKRSFSLVSLKVIQKIASPFNTLFLRRKKPQIFYIHFEAHLYKDQSKTVNKFYNYLKNVVPGTFQDFYYYDSFEKIDVNSAVDGIRVKSLNKNSQLTKVKNELERTIGLKDFDNWLSQYKPKYFADSSVLNGLEYSFGQIVNSFQYWTQVFKTHIPKLIFTVCYYTPQNFGLIWAANRLKIPIFEIQHGHQINYPPYSFSKGYHFNSLPSHFLTWDESSSKFLKTWTQKSKHHQVYKLGNPWITFWINEIKNSGVDYLKDIKRIANNRSIILYTAVSDEDLLTKKITDFVSKNQDKYFWLIRTHPRQSVTTLDYSKHFENLGITNVEVSKSSRLPLPVILMNAEIHITSYSSVAIEASQFGLKNILYSKEGEDRYADLDKMIFVKLDDFENQAYMNDLITKNQVKVQNVKAELNVEPILEVLNS